MPSDAMTFFYPETAFGGFTRVDGTLQFFNRVQALVEPGSVVLDVGAGRGAAHHVDGSAYRRQLQQFKGRCREIIGIDVDPVVLENPNLDRALLIGSDGRFPIEDASIDVIICDHTLEHIGEPARFSEEVRRVLKHGGVFCARTPNRFGYIGLGTNLVPNRLHVRLLRVLQPSRLAEDVFPTQYRLNTRRAIARYFPTELWERALYTWTSEPAYFGGSKLIWGLMLVLFRLVPPSLGATWNIFLRKR